jgi:hypothetical protein
LCALDIEKVTLLLLLRTDGLWAKCCSGPIYCVRAEAYFQFLEGRREEETPIANSPPKNHTNKN